MPQPLLPTVLVAALAVALTAPAHAARFTYHGELMDGDAPAEGRYDLRLRAYAQPGAKTALGDAVELPAVVVAGGRFSVELELPEDADGTTWVEVAVREAQVGGDYAVLGAPQPLTKANSTCPGAWALDGNTGVPDGSFLGFADPASSQPIELRARNSAVARLTPLGGPADHGDAPAVALGSSANLASGFGSTVGGGGATRDGQGAACADCRNEAQTFGVVAGGRGNKAGAFAVVSGGASNDAAGTNSMVGGGFENTATGPYATVLNGFGNRAEGLRGTVLNGSTNTSYDHGLVANGEHNLANNFAFVGGGRDNQALGLYSVVTNGYFNVAAGDYADASGRFTLAGGDHSHAGGHSAVVRQPGTSPTELPFPRSTLDYTGTADGDDGSWVWADAPATASVFRTSGPNQFLVRAQGGVGINTAPPAGNVELTVQTDADDGDFANVWLKQKANANGILLSAGNGGGSNNAGFYIDHFNGGAQARRFELAPDGSVLVRSNITAANTGVSMAANAGAWSSLSDRRLKTAIEAVDATAILDKVAALPLSTWSYIAQGTGVRHIGPMAQDFAAAFDLGENDTTISTIDADGVALAAIQGLNAKLERENTQLRTALETLTARLARLEASRDH